MSIETFRYDGRRALVVGGATGMGAATAKLVSELGGEVVVMDVADVTFPVEQVIQVDLRERPSVEAATDEAAGTFDAVFCCAGVADGTPGLMAINFLSQRHLVERLLERDALPRGAAIGVISSVAGLGWQMDMGTLGEFLDTD